MKKGYEVYAATVDTGGFTQKDILKIKNRAKELYVQNHFFIDGKTTLYNKIVIYIIKGNILRGGVYPLCAGPERIVQAIEVIGVAKK